jgi:hypothetical protein
MPPNQVTITDTRRIASPDARRMGKQDLLVLYQTAEGRRGSVRVAAESATDATIAAAVKADLEDRGKWVNRTLTIS